MNAILREQQEACRECPARNGNALNCARMPSDTPACLPRPLPTEIDAGEVQPSVSVPAGYVHNSVVLKQALELIEEKKS
jgi:hypothetical protein